MKKSLFTKLGTLLLATAFSLPAQAYEEMEGEFIEGGGFVGLGVVSKPDYEGSDTNETIAAPFGRYNFASGRFISLGGAGGSESAGRLRFNVVSRDTSENWSFGPLLQYRLKRDDDIDNKRVKKMKQIDAATELGAFVGYRTGRWSGAMSVAADASSEHDGYIVYLKSNYNLIQDSTHILQLGVNASWADEDYMNTYFGVDSSDAVRSGLPRYKADGGVKNIGISLTGLYNFNSSWGVAGSLSYNSMLNDAEDSPLVDGKKGVGDVAQVNGILALIYSF